MPELTFRVCGAHPIRAAAAPMIGLQLEISSAPEQQPIQTVVLNCQIQIEASRRRYSAREQERLRNVFGEPERWAQTVRALLWTNLTAVVPAFTGSTRTELAVPCTFDLSVAAATYFHAVEGDPATPGFDPSRDLSSDLSLDRNGAVGSPVPIILLFSGTTFYRNAAGLLQASPISWNTEARYALPAGIWQECIDLHHPNTAWLGLRRDVFERLYDFKVKHGLATFDEAVERMVERASEVGA